MSPFWGTVGGRKLRHTLMLGLLVGLAGGVATAETIQVDKMPAAEFACGDFDVLRHDTPVQAEQVYEVLSFVVDGDWAAHGADGIGEDRGTHGDLSLAELCEWGQQHSMPPDQLLLSVNIAPPAGWDATTAVVKRLSVRLGDSVYSLNDALVIKADETRAGEVRLSLSPGYRLDSRASHSPESFRISAEIAAPPGTSVTMSATGDTKEVLNSVGSGQGAGSRGASSIRPSGLHTPYARTAGGGAGGGYQAAYTRPVGVVGRSPEHAGTAAPSRYREPYVPDAPVDEEPEATAARRAGSRSGDAGTGGAVDRPDPGRSGR